jgi:peroxiredoxin
MFKDRGVSFLGVNVSWDTEEAARMFVQARGVPYAVGHDSGNRIGGLYRVDRTPTTFLVARDGNVAAMARGGTMELEDLTSFLEQLLKQNQ